MRGKQIDCFNNKSLLCRIKVFNDMLEIENKAYRIRINASKKRLEKLTGEKEHGSRSK